MVESAIVQQSFYDLDSSACGDPLTLATSSSSSDDDESPRAHIRASPSQKLRSVQDNTFWPAQLERNSPPSYENTHQQYKGRPRQRPRKDTLQSYEDNVPATRSAGKSSFDWGVRNPEATRLDKQRNLQDLLMTEKPPTIVKPANFRATSTLRRPNTCTLAATHESPSRQPRLSSDVTGRDPARPRETRASELRRLKTAMTRCCLTHQQPTGRPVIPELPQLLRFLPLSNFGIKATDFSALREASDTSTRRGTASRDHPPITSRTAITRLAPTPSGRSERFQDYAQQQQQQRQSRAMLQGRHASPSGPFGYFQSFREHLARDSTATEKTKRRDESSLQPNRCSEDRHDYFCRTSPRRQHDDVERTGPNKVAKEEGLTSSTKPRSGWPPSLESFNAHRWGTPPPRHSAVSRILGVPRPSAYFSASTEASTQSIVRKPSPRTALQPFENDKPTRLMKEGPPPAKSYSSSVTKNPIAALPPSSPPPMWEPPSSLGSPVKRKKQKKRLDSIEDEDIERKLVLSFQFTDMRAPLLAHYAPYHRHEI